MPVVQKGRGATNYAQRGMGIKLKEGSGEPPITLIDLVVRSATGTWEASPGYAYKKVTAEVVPQMALWKTLQVGTQFTLQDNMRFLQSRRGLLAITACYNEDYYVYMSGRPMTDDTVSFVNSNDEGIVVNCTHNAYGEVESIVLFGEPIDALPVYSLVLTYPE